MIQIIALLMDSWRMLVARKIFWVSLSISTFLGLLYLSISLVPTGMSFLFGAHVFENQLFRSGTAEGEWFYVNIFTSFINRYWLGSGALLLALISTVSIFPEFIKPGAVEVSLSKPVSRSKLFVVKYLGGLLFVAVQTSVLAVFIFVSLYYRLDYLNWSVFWVVPVITLAFSLIHCVQVLVGILTRSSIVALLAGMCFGVMVWLLQVTEHTMYSQTYALAEEKLEIDWSSGELVGLDSKNEVDADMAKYYELIQTVGAPMPKVRDVVLSLDKLVTFRDSGSMLEQIDLVESLEKNELHKKAKRADRRTRERHSLQYTILTSLGFEVVVLSLTCLVFVRKDY